MAPFGKMEGTVICLLAVCCVLAKCVDGTDGELKARSQLSAPSKYMSL